MKRIFDAEKTSEIASPDLQKGYLKEDKRFVAHHAAREAQEERWHYEVLAEYENGGQDLRRVVDAEFQPPQAAYDEYEEIFVYVPYTAEELAENEKKRIRARRSAECFPIVDRGALWYEGLTAEQKAELGVWYREWLDAPQTCIAPKPPIWMK